MLQSVAIGLVAPGMHFATLCDMRDGVLNAARWFVVGGLTLVVGLGCRSSTHHAPPSDPLAFHDASGTLVHSQPSYRAAVSPSGALSLSPQRTHTRKPTAAVAAAGCAFETVRVAGAEVPSTHARLGAHGEALLSRGLARESIENRDGSVEQSWEFAHAPGDGPLEVRVRAHGCGFASATSTGLHFPRRDHRCRRRLRQRNLDRRAR